MKPPVEIEPLEIAAEQRKASTYRGVSSEDPHYTEMDTSSTGRDELRVANIESEQQIQERQESTLSCSTTDTSISDMNALGPNLEPQHLHEIAASSAPKASPKLRTTSRAICLFRRAAGSLSRSLTMGQMSKQTVSSDGGGGDDDERREQPSTAGKRRKSSTYRRFLMRRQGTGNSSRNSSQSSSRNQGGASNCATGLNNASQTSSSGEPNQQQQLPHHQQAAFIVPRLNALKLPLKCLIRSLEGELMREVFVHRYELGQYLIENLKVSLGMNDCKYFGLRLAKSCDDQEDLKNIWLDLNESVWKQIKNKSSLFSQAAVASNSKGGLSNGEIAASSSCSSYSNGQLNRSSSNISRNISNNSSTSSSGSNSRTIEFYLRIKFYPPNLTRIQDSFLKNYLWLQLRRDLRLGKLTSSMNNLAQLMACILQFEFGDFKQELIERLPELNIMPNQDLVEDAAIELWRTNLIGFKRHQAQMQFLRAAIILETYGFDYYSVKDHQRQRAYLLGFNYAGIKTIRNGRIVHHFRWHSISKISYERRMIIFHIYPTENSKRKQILGFKCMSNEDCQCLYMRVLEQKYFFTVDLTYFDKSVRRPSCLYSSPNSAGSSQSVVDWSSNSFDEQQSLANNFNSAGRPSIIPTSSSLEETATARSVSPPSNYSSQFCPPSRQQQDQQQPPHHHHHHQFNPPSELTRAVNSNSFDDELADLQSDRQSASSQVWQRRAKLTRLHSQRSDSPTELDEVGKSELSPRDGLLANGAGGPVVAAAAAASNKRPALVWLGAIAADWRLAWLDRPESTLVRGNSLPPDQSPLVSRLLDTWLQRRSSSIDRLLAPMLKLLFVILVTNLIFKLTDSLSCALIALLTFGAGGAACSDHSPIPSSSPVSNT